jgi:hypothetical protein
MQEPEAVCCMRRAKRKTKVIVENRAQGYVACPLGLKGVVVGEGDTYEEALAGVQSAVRFPYRGVRQGSI